MEFVNPLNKSYRARLRCKHCGASRPMPNALEDIGMCHDCGIDIEQAQKKEAFGKAKVITADKQFSSLTEVLEYIHFSISGPDPRYIFEKIPMRPISLAKWYNPFSYLKVKWLAKESVDTESIETFINSLR